MAITGYGTTNRGIQKHFQHFEETISRCFHKVLNALILIYVYYVQLPLNTYKTDDWTKDDSKYRLYIRYCLGTLDRTHIFAHVPHANRS